MKPTKLWQVRIQCRLFIPFQFKTQTSNAPGASQFNDGTKSTALNSTLPLQTGKDERGQDTRTKGYENVAEKLAPHGSLISLLCEPPGPSHVLCFQMPWFLIAKKKHPSHRGTQLSTQDAVQDTKNFLDLFQSDRDTGKISIFPACSSIPMTNKKESRF